MAEEFQKEVRADIAWGIPGEIILGMAPDVRAEPVALAKPYSGETTPFGKAVTKAGDASLGYDTIEATATPVEIGGSGEYIGILSNPKAAYSYLPVGAKGAGLTVGQTLEAVSDCHGIVVEMTGPAKVGQPVGFAADGSLQAGGGTLIPGARVVRFDTTKGLAIISLNQMPGSGSSGGNGGGNGNGGSGKVPPETPPASDAMSTKKGAKS